MELTKGTNVRVVRERSDGTKQTVVRFPTIAQVIGTDVWVKEYEAPFTLRLNRKNVLQLDASCFLEPIGDDDVLVPRRPPRRSYDPACFDLAEHFLTEGRPPISDAMRGRCEELAADVQDFIEARLDEPEELP